MNTATLPSAEPSADVSAIASAVVAETALDRLTAEAESAIRSKDLRTLRGALIHLAEFKPAHDRLPEGASREAKKAALRQFRDDCKSFDRLKSRLFRAARDAGLEVAEKHALTVLSSGGVSFRRTESARLVPAKSAVVRL